MKKSVAFTTTVATIGLATVLTLSAVAPSQAATTHKSAASKSASVKSAKSLKAHKSGSGKKAPKVANDNRQFTSVNFTVNNVPSTITDANVAAQLLVAKVVPLAADATSAPETAPLPTAPAASNGAPSFGDGKGHHGKGGKHADSLPAGTAPADPSVTPDPTNTAAPSFGDNDGDGPKAGFDGGQGGHGRGHGMKFSNLSLVNGVLTGTIEIPGDETANVQNWGIYLSIAADSANGIVAQSSTPVMVTVTTASDLTATVTATTGDVVITLPTA
jgi:hypothetical protein